MIVSSVRTDWDCHVLGHLASGPATHFYHLKSWLLSPPNCFASFVAAWLGALRPKIIIWFRNIFSQFANHSWRLVRGPRADRPAGSAGQSERKKRGWRRRRRRRRRRKRWRRRRRKHLCTSEALRWRSRGGGCHNCRDLNRHAHCACLPHWQWDAKRHFSRILDHLKSNF